jgi:hypothetical protein
VAHGGTTLHPHRASARPAGNRGRVVTITLALVALVAVAASLLAVRLATGADSGAALSGPALEAPGGAVQVLAVKPETMNHPAEMPAEMMPDPVPAGFRRVSVELVLLGTAESGLPYDGADFRVSGPGVEPVAPVRDAVGSGVVPEGARLTGSLLFQVPVDAESLNLTLAGTRGSIPVTLPAAPGHDGHPATPGPSASASPGASHQHGDGPDEH